MRFESFMSNQIDVWLCGLYKMRPQIWGHPNLNVGEGISTGGLWGNKDPDCY